MEKLLFKQNLYREAIDFCKDINNQTVPELIGVTDGKAIGTYIEHAFKLYLHKKYTFSDGNSACGIDLPDRMVNTDIKVTYINQPQSSCPYKSSRQKIFGLGYNILVMVYDRNTEDGLMPIKFINVTFIDEKETADYTTTMRLREMIKDGANKDDIVAFLNDKNIPGDEIVHSQLADEIIARGINQGYLTISNALQWRLQYSRVISLNNKINGISNYDFNE